MFLEDLEVGDAHLLNKEGITIAEGHGHHIDLIEEINSKESISEVLHLHEGEHFKISKIEKCFYIFEIPVL